jgi:hypothetical protein
MTDEKATPSQQYIEDQQKHLEATAFASIVMAVMREFIADRCRQQAYEELRQAFLKSDSVVIHRMELETLRELRSQMMRGGPFNIMPNLKDAFSRDRRDF